MEEHLSEPEKWYWDTVIRRCLRALEKKGFQAKYAACKKDAAELVLSEIRPGESVGIGGSVTIRQLGLPSMLKMKGCTVFDHWDPELSAEGKKETRQNQVKADVFLSSTNALTMDGSLVQTDGTGNRVGSMIFGPSASIVVAGYNKIVRDIPEAFQRIRNYAAPVNYKRLGHLVPCTEPDGCLKCNSQGCRVTAIIEAPPSGKERFLVVLVGERLGY